MTVRDARNDTGRAAVIPAKAGIHRGQGRQQDKPTSSPSPLMGEETKACPSARHWDQRVIAMRKHRNPFPPRFPLPRGMTVRVAGNDGEGRGE